MISSSFRVMLSAKLLAFAVSFIGLQPSIAVAQPNAPRAAEATWNNRFVPDDAFAVIFASPAELIQNDAFNLLPVEIFQLQVKETFGIDPSDIATTKIILGLPDPRQPAFGIVLEMTRPFDEARLMESLNADANPTSIGKFTAYPIAVGPPGTLVHAFDDKTLVIALPNYLESILTADRGSGPLPSLIALTPAQDGISILMVMDSVRQVVSQAVSGQARLLPRQFLPLAQLPQWTESVRANFQFTNRSAKLEVTMTFIDDELAVKAEEIINAAIGDARDLAPDLAKRTMPRNAADELRAAIDKYIDRVVTLAFETIAVKRTERNVVTTVASELGITGGIVISNVLPSMDRLIRSLSRQLDGTNNFRQVMLALHNYHDAYNRLPPPAITDADGKPLLSWRVAILPFIEEQALYEQFRLNEPWDSEHNLPLSKHLPKVYATAGLRLPIGHTAVHAVVGDQIGVRPSEKTAFRDFLDGLSNTILIVESTADSAVPWTKPDDVEIDLEDPLAKFVGSPKKSFQVGMGDGSIQRLADEIDPEKFKAMLTRAGGEIIRP